MYMKKLTRQVVCSHTEPIVETPMGKIRGLKSEDVYLFRGVQYATAKRFRQPEPIAPWTGVKDALRYGYTCPELEPNNTNDQFNVPHIFYPKAEDCLYLNVYTTSLDKNAKKPVMVWLHGGGFSTGSGIDHYAYDGDNMAVYGDVVVVTLNHRLNVLGYLDLSAYGEEYANSGNAGIADIIAALQWVHDNIACFGGDPDRVLIFGQSGGGGKVCALLQCPAADGLFHRAIVHSGIHERRARPSAEVSKVLVGEMLKYLNIAPEEIEKLEQVSYAELVEAYDAVTPGLRAQGLEVDGWAPLNNGYYQGYARLDGFYEHALKVPTMIGTCFGEFGRHPQHHRKYDLTRDEIMGFIREKYGDNADRMAEMFEKAYPEKSLMDLLVLDANVRTGSLDHLIKRSAFEGSAPVYCYMFAPDFRNFDGGKAALHGFELPYAFHTTSRSMLCQQEGVEKLEDEIAGAWAAFAHSGNPNHAALPEWPAFTPDNKATMVFWDNTDLRVDYDTELVFWKKELDPSFGAAMNKVGVKK